MSPVAMQCYSADSNPQGSSSFWEDGSGSASPSFSELYPDPHQSAKPDLPQSAMPDPGSSSKGTVEGSPRRCGGTPWCHGGSPRSDGGSVVQCCRFVSLWWGYGNGSALKKPNWSRIRIKGKVWSKSASEWKAGSWCGSEALVLNF